MQNSDKEECEDGECEKHCDHSESEDEDESPAPEVDVTVDVNGEIEGPVEDKDLDDEMDDEDEEVSDEEKGEFTVRLPKAKVLTNVLDKDSWQYFDEKGDVFKPLTVEEVGASYNDIAKEEEDKAIARGLLDDAEKMAQTIAMNYLSENAAVGDNKITVVFGAK